MTRKLRLARALALLAMAATCAAGQSLNFDPSGNGALKGRYFVREVALRNVSSQGAIGEAISVTGVATFDGAGRYAFSGQLADSASQTGAVSASFSGAYSVAANGFLRIASFALTGAFPTRAAVYAYGGVGAVGPSAFTASATESSNTVFDLMVAVPMGASVSSASLTGLYRAVYLDFPQAAAGQARQASLSLQADGAGGFAAITATGSASGNASLVTQTIPGATYTLSGTDGTLNFGASAPNQLFIGGTQAFYLSADRNLLVGGTPGGYDLLLASPAVAGASNASFQGFYFVGGLETDNSEWSSQALCQPDAFHGSMNSNGQGSYTSHLRLNTNGYSVEDLTSGWSSSVQANGSFTPGDGSQYWLGASGQVALALGQGNFYSIVAGLHAANYAPANPVDVFLHPLGIVNAASFAPATNPVAPQEMLTLFGSNLATGVARASSFPLPTTLLGTRVLVNGVPAPLLAVSPTQITLLAPGAISPDLTAYAAFEVQNSGAACPTGSQCPTSNLVTMFTNYTAPGVFSIAQNGFGAAAAINPSGVVFGASNPAKPGDIPMLFLTGLGSVTPALADGVPASPTGQPLYLADIYNASALALYFGGFASTNIPFAGVATGYAPGFYQINAQIPAGISSGENFLDILTPDAEARQATLTVVSVSKSTAALRSSATARSGRSRRAMGSGSAVRPRAPVSR